MDNNALKVLIAKAQQFLPSDEFTVFRNQVNEVYLQDKLHSLYAGMPLDKECEPWRAEQIALVNKQLASIQ